VDFSNTALSGNITVKAKNDCNETAVVSQAITVKPLVGTIGSISGTTTLCAGSTGVTYSIPAVDNALSYEWTLPTGASGTSTTNEIKVDFSNTALSGNITVKAKNDCNWSTISSLAITVNAKPISPTITLIPKMYENVLHSNSTTGNQWYNSKGAIIGAVNQDYNVLANEEYYVLVSNSSCVSEPSNIIKITNTAIHSPAMLESIKMYPNPVRNELKIDFDGETDISIVNLMGQVVYSANLIKNVVVQTSTLPSGVYLVKFGKGSIFAIKKFVKEQ
ncbi:MAG: T9SS type A sorting domain-containing protein, partial [Bacteroidales bacterium]